MQRATSSLPVPVSPWISTVASVGATRSMCSYTDCDCGEAKTTAFAPSHAFVDGGPKGASRVGGGADVMAFVRSGRYSRSVNTETRDTPARSIVAIVLATAP